MMQGYVMSIQRPRREGAVLPAHSVQAPRCSVPEWHDARKAFGRYRLPRRITLIAQSLQDRQFHARMFFCPQPPDSP